MRILFLTQVIPYPHDAGPKIKTWHVMRYLAERGHEIILTSFLRRDEESQVPELCGICKSVHTIPILRSRIADVYYWLRSYVTQRPFLIERDDFEAMHQVVRDQLAKMKIDIIHADQLSMAQFVARNVDLNSSSRPFLVFDAHNAVWTIVEQMRKRVPRFIQPVLVVEAQRLKRFEGQVVNEFDHTLAVTESDRQALLQALTTVVDGSSSIAKGRSSITVIPISVDTSKLQPIKRMKTSKNILALGTLHYPPNADGIRWFVSDIFPLIREHVPEAKLTIVGKNPPRDFIELQHRNPNSIHVTGYAPDLIPYLEDACLMVVPVRAGGGMRVRILEGFAWAMPMVTTTVGLEGIDAQPGEHVLVADSELEFTTAVIRLLNDSALQERLAINGRRLAKRCYDWHVVLKRLDAVYNRVLWNQNLVNFNNYS